MRYFPPSSDLKRSHAESPLGPMLVGRGVDRSVPSDAQLIHEAHLRQLEETKLVGYRFLKPPGISKTMKMLQEEQDYQQETGSLTRQTTSLEFFSIGRNANVTEDETFVSNDNIPPVDRAQHSDPEDFDFTPDMSLPTMNASLPSLYLPPPDTHG